MYILLLKRCGHWSFLLICDFVRTNLISLSCNFSNNFFFVEKSCCGISCAGKSMHAVWFALVAAFDQKYFAANPIKHFIWNCELESHQRKRKRKTCMQCTQIGFQACMQTNSNIMQRVSDARMRTKTCLVGI